MIDDFLMEPDTSGDEEKPSMYGTPAKKPRNEDALKFGSPSDTRMSPGSACSAGQGEGAQSWQQDVLETIDDINAPLLAHVECKGELKELTKEMDQAQKEGEATLAFVNSRDFDQESSGHQAV